MKRKQKKELLQLALPASWWLTLSHFIDEREDGMGVLGINADPWEVVYTVSKAIQKQFPAEAED